ncbi:hypothetical protein QUF75_01910 [Desulfococcaceae bacterium HSG7]|nr:hypothetical protein [Desulfococcaceae bacterium HSG7]
MTTMSGKRESILDLENFLIIQEEESMGATYGVGLLGHLPADMPEKVKIEVMHSFAVESRVDIPIREVISGRVAEWNPVRESDDGGFEYEMRWLDEAEAEPILTFARQEQHFAPYSQFSFLDGWQVFIPGATCPRKPIRLPLPNQESTKLRINTLREGIAGMDGINRKIKRYKDDFWEGESYTCDEYTAFHTGIGNALRQCRKHQLIYVIGD